MVDYKIDSVAAVDYYYYKLGPVPVEEQEAGNYYSFLSGTVHFVVVAVAVVHTDCSCSNLNDLLVGGKNSPDDQLDCTAGYSQPMPAGAHE